MKSSDKLRQNIRDFREDRGLTQAQMAEKLNLSVEGYAKIERGSSQVKIDRLEQIACVLGISVADLIPFGEDSVYVFNNNADNSSTFNVAVGDPALNAEINLLRQMIEMKNELLTSREREIDSLKQQVETLQKLVAELEK
ncbi:hypothetical protein B0187_06870 [Haemophilus paracuniculus]|uniref:HTH cro/C1-type domain-containing protein n=1 Tax=Haemophilus paracuniculus TaxID=734 RepID=A0A1T0ARJ8_9PAST|nr:helix-turn-helix transcriptional regulator [Haemophilus paracuniculus]OOR98975.1 hypothetical protein B0187_06870 [Haemophilus paracuniculus]